MQHKTMNYNVWKQIITSLDHQKLKLFQGGQKQTKILIYQDKKGHIFGFLTKKLIFQSRIQHKMMNYQGGKKVSANRGFFAVEQLFEFSFFLDRCLPARHHHRQNIISIGHLPQKIQLVMRVLVGPCFSEKQCSQPVFLNFLSSKYSFEYVYYTFKNS